MSSHPPETTHQSSQSCRICLFGGTFDPIHEGHIHIATAAQKQLSLDKVVFLPCRQSPHKKTSSIATADQRLEMCHLATKGLSWAQVDNYDILAEGPVYSWQTAEYFKILYPHAKLFWLMGTDQWTVLPRWNHPERLAQAVDFIVHSRDTKPKIQNNYSLHSIDGDHPASATAIRENYGNNPEIKSWLNRNVADYIHAQGLYSKPDDK